MIHDTAQRDASIPRKLFLLAKWISFPGLDVGTRKRRKFLKYFRRGGVETLDVGCGNGAFSFAAYRFGNRVLGIDYSDANIQKCEEFREYIGAERARCEFKTWDIYALDQLGASFDQIICFEVLEHLKEDRRVLELFFRSLKPGGALHLSTPRENRRPYAGEILSSDEDGGHVRLGYTLASLISLLQETGFEIAATDSAVGAVSTKVLGLMHILESRLANVPNAIRFSILAGCLVLLYPFTYLDALGGKAKHLTIYVMAVKPADAPLASSFVQ